MAKSVPAPVHTLPDGRQFISEEACEETREVAEFVKRYPKYWIRDYDLCGYVAAKGFTVSS